MKFKKLTKKAEKLFRSDVRLSFVLASLLLNLFFFSGVLAFNATNLLDQPLYKLAKSNLCDENYEENLSSIVADANNKELAKLEFEAECNAEAFQPYYDNAIESFYSEEI